MVLEYILTGGGVLTIMIGIIKVGYDHHSRLAVLEQMAKENQHHHRDLAKQAMERHNELNGKIDTLFGKVDDVNKFLRNGAKRE